MCIRDSDNSLNLDTSVIENSITKNTKALLPVHMMGAPVDMVGIQSTAKKYNLIIVEDNAQCCGGTYQGKLLGTFGQASAFSFDGGKTLMTGEGGMVLTNDEKVFIRSRAYHDHGHAYNTSVGRGEDFAIMNGFNYRMTELQGAIGIEQLKKLDFIIDEQRKNKKKIKEQIYHLPLEFRKINDEGEIGDTIVFFLPTLEITQKFMDKMRSVGMGTKNLPDALNWHFAGKWQHLFNKILSQQNYRWDKSKLILERSIALPVMVNMSDSKIDEISSNIKKFCTELL